MPPTTKKLLESLGGALMSVLVGVHIAGDALVHLFAETTGDAPEVLLDTLLISPNNHLDDVVHEFLLSHSSLHPDEIPTDGSEEGCHLFLFIKLRPFIRFLIISIPIIILIITLLLPIKPIFIVLIISPHIIIIAATSAVSSTVKHSLLLLEKLSLPLRLSRPVVRFSSVSLSPSTLLAPVFYKFNLEGCCPSMPTTLAGNSEAFDGLVIGNLATVLDGNFLTSFVDFLTIVAHPGASLGLAYDQSACLADLPFVSIMLVLPLFVPLPSGLLGHLLLPHLVDDLLVNLCLFVRICGARVRSSSGSGSNACLAIVLDGFEGVLAMNGQQMSKLPSLAALAGDDECGLETVVLLGGPYGSGGGLKGAEVLHIECD